jgi:hypothetical protein
VVEKLYSFGACDGVATLRGATVRAWGYGEEAAQRDHSQDGDQVLVGFAQFAGGGFPGGEKLVVLQVGELEKLLTEGEDHGFPQFRLVRKPQGRPDGAVNTTNLLKNVPNVQGEFCRSSSSIVSSLFPPGLRFSDRVRDRSGADGFGEP